MINLSLSELKKQFTSLQTNIYSPCVFLETRKLDTQNHFSYYFTEPEKIITFYQQDDLSNFFNQLKKACDNGHWLAGYFCYEMGYFFEPRLRKFCPNIKNNYPLAWFGVFQEPLVVDEHYLHQNSNLILHPFLNTQMDHHEIDDLQINLIREEYLQAISKIKSYLREGDTYQVNMTMKYKFSFNKNPLDLFRFLQNKQNAAYTSFINNGHNYCLSLSPEMFFRKKGEEMISKPMKGTAKRGRFNSEDVENARWLTNDPKNHAENTMIVDLVRNDLGKLSFPGSVRVADAYHVERFSTLQQMTSTIKSTLRPDTTHEDIFKAMFPFGSITGAPKIRTMEIINELEKEPRGIYTGAIGYFSPRGDSQFSVAIRTIEIDNEGNGEMGIGGGIVAESSADDEFSECLLKANFLTDRFDPFSLIETMGLEKGQIILLNLHLKRLKDSAHFFEISCPVKRINKDLQNLCKERMDGQHKIRLLLHQNGQYEIHIQRIEKDLTNIPLLIKISGIIVNSESQWLYHKTTNRELYDKERMLALNQGYDEVIFLNERGEVTEGAISNVFLEQSGKLTTPIRNSGLLNGTLRQSLLDNHKCKETTVLKENLLKTGKFFIGNSVMGLVEAKLESPFRLIKIHH